MTYYKVVKTARWVRRICAWKSALAFSSYMASGKLTEKALSFIFLKEVDIKKKNWVNVKCLYNAK